MRRASRALLCAIAALSASCSDVQQTAEPDVGRARFYMDCTLSQGDCKRIEGAINLLVNSGFQDCQQAGNMAKLRYDAPSSSGYGFAPGNAADAGTNDAYVWMATSSNYYSGYGPVDDHTYVMQTAFAYSSTALASLMAHEEVHHTGHDGPNHHTGLATSLQGACP